MSARVKVLAPRIANTWLLDDGEGHRFLIDSGHRVERASLGASLRRAGVRKGGLTAVLLTHRHSDHACNAAWVRRELGCPVICHPAEAPTLTGEIPARPLAGRGAGPIDDALCRVEDRFPARSPVDDVYSDGTWRWGFEVIGVAGHTAGSSLLLHEPSGTLFTGDALLSGVPVQRFAVRLSLAIPAYSEDVGACHRAVLAFLAEGRPVKTVCTGHGPVLRRNVPALFASVLARRSGAQPSVTSAITQ